MFISFKAVHSQLSCIISKNIVFTKKFFFTYVQIFHDNQKLKKKKKGDSFQPHSWHLDYSHYFQQLTSFPQVWLWHLANLYCRQYFREYLTWNPKIALFAKDLHSKILHKFSQLKPLYHFHIIKSTPAVFGAGLSYFLYSGFTIVQE